MGAGALEFQLAAGKRFCDPPLPSSSQVWDEFMALDPRDETVTAAGLMSLEDDEVDTVGVPLAEGLISTSRTASALERAGHFLILSGHDLPQLQRVPMPADAGDAQARLDLQKMALDMVACDIRGGCGAGGLQTLAWCGRHCGPGVSRQDVWRLSTPPTHYAYARRLADEIRADRRRATKR